MLITRYFRDICKTLLKYIMDLSTKDWVETRNTCDLCPAHFTTPHHLSRHRDKVHKAKSAVILDSEDGK